MFGTTLTKPLDRRTRVTVELPEFVIRAIKYCVDKANDEQVTFDDVIEWLLASELSIRRMPHVEQSIPGFTAAMLVWLMNATYQLLDEY